MQAFRKAVPDRGAKGVAVVTGSSLDPSWRRFLGGLLQVKKEL